MSKLSDYVDQIAYGLSHEDISNLHDDDTPLIEAVDTFIDHLAFDEKLELLTENSHLKHLYEEPQINLSNFDTIVNSCCYNLICASCRARLIN